MPDMTYDRLLKKGRQVIVLPILSTDDKKDGSWAPYGVLERTKGAKSSWINVYYINHVQHATCPFQDLYGVPLDPRRPSASSYVCRDKQWDEVHGLGKYKMGPVVAPV